MIERIRSQVFVILVKKVYLTAEIAILDAFVGSNFTS